MLLTRADGPLADALREAGADVDAVALTHTVPVAFPRLPQGATWLVLTSPTAVAVLLDQGYDPRSLGHSVAAVGPATRRALADAGVEVALTPETSSDAESLAAAFPPGTGSVLIPGSALARPVLADALRAKGWHVDAVPTYTTEPLAGLPEDLRDSWDRGDYDAVVLMAGSGVRALVTLLGAPPDRTRVVTFGRPSAAVAQAQGLQVAAVAPTQDGTGLVAALGSIFGKEL
ncbi:uroporphyrinogen-III synthase [Nigerium massiliense]|uniref:uroporphyrinogen-III synthase n=1 Tax=Nigerium massiliense TaxID=1522317 RepID=UPI001F4840AE|nr:uroporphyrinogen-III synthase [Nigerium massiliense]